MSDLPLIWADALAEATGGRVRACCSTRAGGVSEGVWSSLNLGDHVGDNPRHVAENRHRLAAAAGLDSRRIGWLSQVHGTTVVDLDATPPGVPEADASVSRTQGTACAILTADCLPVVLADKDGQMVGAAHAGWRGLCEGVIERLAASMSCPPGRLVAWLGPAIGPEQFEVGPEVRDAFVRVDSASAAAFTAEGARPGRLMADIYQLARRRLERAGVSRVMGGGECTVTDADRFFSYRRDGQTGRMATLVWRAR
ncbi:peptidoglycan editing factor PgeF [Marinobacter sp. C2H3]|uniref:peptidoglycan editing factor PgeF n=1 Tax=Marinobacter sp. C2H3 TaxID=3119003 RepID=UPI00300F164B